MVLAKGFFLFMSKYVANFRTFLFFLSTNTFPTFFKNCNFAQPSHSYKFFFSSKQGYQGYQPTKDETLIDSKLFKGCSAVTI